MSTSDEGTHPAAAGAAYDRHYYETALGAEPYDRAQSVWTDFFAAVADRIVADIKPQRVLDVGCAKGFLVEALRDRGVEAFGIDVSEYAISEVRADIKPFCRVASATAPLEGRWDLIACIEVLEHLDEAAGRRAISNICAVTDDVLFSSAPDDFAEPTHVNVRPTPWWLARFAEQAFALDVDYDATFVARHAVRVRGGANGSALLEDPLADRYRLHHTLLGLRQEAAALQKRQARLSSDLAAVQRGAQAVRSDLQTVRAALAASQRDLAASQHDLAALREGAEEKDRLIAGLNYHLLAVQRTIGWKVLERLRRLRDRALPADSRRRDLYWQIRRPLEVLLDEGPTAVFRKTQHKIRQKRRGQEFLVKVPPPEAAPNRDLQYQLWIERHRL